LHPDLTSRRVFVFVRLSASAFSSLTVRRPEQVTRVPELAPDFVGREQELCDMLFEKYGADLSSVQDAAAPVAQEGEWEED